MIMFLKILLSNKNNHLLNYQLSLDDTTVLEAASYYTSYRCRPMVAGTEADPCPLGTFRSLPDPGKGCWFSRLPGKDRQCPCEC